MGRTPRRAIRVNREIGVVPRVTAQRKSIGVRPVSRDRESSTKRPQRGGERLKHKLRSVGTMARFEASLEATTEVNDESLREAQGWVGRRLKITRYNTEASRDNIRHYAIGLGDMNPLWTDIAYGRRSMYGVNLAPPTFLNSVYDSAIIPGMPGLGALRIGSEWTFHETVRLGDQLDATAEVASAELVPTRDGSHRILQTGLTRYYRSNPGCGPVLIAELRNRSLRVSARGRGKGSLDIAPRKVYEYSEDELAAIADQVRDVKVRGAEARYWEDISVGDSVGTVVKGPYSRMAMHCYYAGAAGSANYVAHDLWWKYRELAATEPERLPTNALPPEYFAGTGVTSLGHHDSRVAERMGMPGAYDNGNQRTGMVANLLSNWMGDAGFLAYLDVNITRPVIEGDTLWISGTVTQKATAAPTDDVRIKVARERVEEVSGECAAVNQFGDTVATGRWRVGLPCRR
jgi:acyl dehydratase